MADRVALCIPTLGPPTWTLFDSIGKWQTYHYTHRQDVMVTTMRPPRTLPIDVARSWLVTKFLEGDWDYLWFVDQDAAFTPDTLERLLAWDVPIVGALCMIRASEKCMPMVFRGQREPGSDYYRIPVQEISQFLNEHADIRTNKPQVVNPVPEDALFECDFIGCHCSLLRRDVLERMEPPWFNGLPGQEDKYFYLKAAGLGYRTCVDLSTVVGHTVGERIIGVYDFMAHLLYESILEEYDNGGRTEENA